MQRGNSKVKLIKAQLELNTLKDGIATFRPDVVLFFTAPGYSRHLSRVLFGARETSILRGAIEQVLGLEKELAPGGVTFRTQHPQATRYLKPEELMYRIRTAKQ